MSQHESQDTERDAIDAYIDGTIAPEEFSQLEEQLADDADLRAELRRRVALDENLRSALAPADESVAEASNPWLETETHPQAEARSLGQKILAFMPTAAAAALAFLLGAALIKFNTDDTDIADTSPSRDSEEPVAEGFAAVSNLFDVHWAGDSKPKAEGDILGAEVVKLASGTAEIQFFSGATMSLEGPATISLKSAWEATCSEGAVRMRVPPAARGFKLHGPATEIVDLGTEFGLAVRNGEAQVEVFDGEIEVSHRGASKKLLTKGGALELPQDRAAEATQPGEIAFPDARQFDDLSEKRLGLELARRRAHQDQLAADQRLIAYYTFENSQPNSLIPNLAASAAQDTDGAAVLAEPATGRVHESASALEFRRPGARVRINLPGEFPAFTFATWVRIDSLDRWYNALLMSDSYETGEPHWQIRDDGKLMLSIMVDDTKRHPVYPDKSRYHHVYYSPPIWDRSMSGQWLHLASTFDPAKRQVCHFVNGEQVSAEDIDPLFQIKTLCIGNAEIGNWAQPFREDPSFAIRNFNGRIDETAIFKAALSADDITELYERSRPGLR